MGLRVRFASRALSDLVEIRNYLLEHSPSAAERFRQHVMAAIDRLSDFPMIGRATDEPNVRVLILTRYPYLVFYSVTGQDVVILHVRNGARDTLDPSSL